MKTSALIDQLISNEVSFQSSKSWGKWGQNINKRETKVELLFDILNSPSLTPAQKSKCISLAGNAVSKDGVLRIVAQEERYQVRNKLLTIARFTELIKKTLTVDKKRIPTRTPSRVKEEIHASKKVISQRQYLRQKPTVSSDDF